MLGTKNKIGSSVLTAELKSNQTGKGDVNRTPGNSVGLNGFATKTNLGKGIGAKLQLIKRWMEKSSAFMKLERLDTEHMTKKEILFVTQL